MCRLPICQEGASQLSCGRGGELWIKTHSSSVAQTFSVMQLSQPAMVSLSLQVYLICAGRYLFYKKCWMLNAKTSQGEPSPLNQWRNAVSHNCSSSNWLAKSQRWVWEWNEAHEMCMSQPYVKEYNMSGLDYISVTDERNANGCLQDYLQLTDHS